METLKWVVSILLAILVICVVITSAGVLAAIGATAGVITLGAIIVGLVAAGIKEWMAPPPDTDT